MMTPFFDIRIASQADCPALAQIQVDSYRSAYAGLLPQAYLDHFTYEEQTQDWRDMIAAGGEDVLLVAQTASAELVGYAVGRPGPADIAPYDSELVSLHVRRAAQQQGVASRLVAEAAASLQARGCVSLMLWVLTGNPAINFYERLGGQLLGSQIKLLGEEDQETRVEELAYGWPDIRGLEQAARQGQA